MCKTESSTNVKIGYIDTFLSYCVTLITYGLPLGHTVRFTLHQKRTQVGFLFPFKIPAEYVAFSGSPGISMVYPSGIMIGNQNQTCVPFWCGVVLHCNKI